MKRFVVWGAVGALGLAVFFLVNGWLLGSLSALLVAAAHGPPDLAGWQAEWLMRPFWAIRQVLSPSTRFEAVSALWKSLQPIVAVGLGWLGWWLWQWRRNTQTSPIEASQYGSHGTARWMTASERQQLLRSDGPGLLLGGADGKLWRLETRSDGPLNDFVILFGPSKSGKSSRYAIPNMIHEESSSIVATDPKGELYQQTAALKRKQGYEVMVVNLKQFSASLRYNPLAYCHTPQDVFTLAYTLIYNTAKASGSDDSLWLPAEQAYLSSLMLYVLHERPKEEGHLASVLRLATTVARHPKQMDALFDKLKPDHAALQAYNIFRLAADAEKMRSGIITGAAVKLRLWTIPELAELTGANDFDIRQLGRKLCCLYLILPDDTAAFAPLTSMLFTQIMQELYREADQHGGRLKTPVRLRLDEAANVGRFPEFAAKIATMRSRGLSPEIILQDLGQLQRLYPDSWSTIVANCDVQVVMGVNDQLTADYISRRLGNQTIQTMSTGHSSHATGGSASESHSYTGRSLMFPGEILAMPRDTMLVCLAGQPPAKLTKVPYTGAAIESENPFEYQPPLRGELKTTEIAVTKKKQPDPSVKADALAFLDKT